MVAAFSSGRCCSTSRSLTFWTIGNNCSDTTQSTTWTIRSTIWTWSRKPLTSIRRSFSRDSTTGMRQRWIWRHRQRQAHSSNKMAMATAIQANQCQRLHVTSHDSNCIRRMRCGKWNIIWAISFTAPTAQGYSAIAIKKSVDYNRQTFLAHIQGILLAIMLFVK